MSKEGNPFENFAEGFPRSRNDGTVKNNKMAKAWRVRAPLDRETGPIEKLKRNMTCWGLRDSKETHKSFQKAMLDELNRILQAKEESANGMIQPVRLSHNPKDCILQALTQEVELMIPKENFGEVVDVLPEFCVGPPYFWSTGEGRMKLRSQFTNLPIEDIDPLERFNERIVSVEEHFRKIWATTDGYKAPAFRALVGNQTCDGKRQCISCHRPTLCWNSSTVVHPHWTKLFCITCKSTYEIKAFAKETTFQQRINTVVLNNTSKFAPFQNLEASSRAKRYIIMLSTEGVGPHPVAVAEIVGVDPQLRDRSFVGDKLRIYSLTRFKIIKKSWFEIPASSNQSAKDIHNEVLDILDEKFSVQEKKSELEKKK